MMQKRTVYSLLLISFIVVFAASLSFANTVTIQSKSDIPRCADQVVNVDIEVTENGGVDALEFVFEVTEGLDVTAITWDPSLTVLTSRFADLSKVDGVGPDTIRFAALKAQSGDASLAAGSYTVAQIEFITDSICDGSVNIDNAEWTYPNPTGVITTQFVAADDNSIVLPAVTAGTVTITNQAPTVEAIPDATLPWGDAFVYQIEATDPDTAGGCEALTYTKISGPADLTVNPNTGLIQWPTEGEDVCTHEVEVGVEDACGEVVTRTFEICVTNEAPTLTCPDDQQICFGDTLRVTAVGDDPDGGPYPLSYSVVSTDAPGMVMIDPNTGEITWATETSANYTGTFEICVSVSDSANVCDPCSPRNADTCCFAVTVISNQVTIETELGNSGLGVIQGGFVDVSVDILGPEFNNYPLGGYDLLIEYDPTALALEVAEPGDFILDCGWEYFTFRFGPDGNCGNACPEGKLRIVALAETNNGANHPDCFVNGGGVTSTQLANLRFLVSNNRTLECQFVPIRFCWYDCGDNVLSSVEGDTAFISRRVMDWDGSRIEADAPFPTLQGANSTCDVSDKVEPVRCLDFMNGGVKIICGDDIDAVGDINLNGVAYEVADVVMFTNYFIEGLAAFDDHVDGSIAASDANRDGLPLTVSDLVYLIRVVVGDAQPYPKEVANKFDATAVNFTHVGGKLATTGDAEIGAAYVVVEGEVNPYLLADNMEMDYRFDGTNTRIIVTPNMESATLEGFTGEFLGGVNGEILTLEMATVAGYPVTGTNVPTNYELAQNYPNPFNPTTTIAFAVPTAGEYKLTIYNINGQVVESFSGTIASAGHHEVVWEAGNNASGVYLYRLEVNDFSEVRKMVLLK